MGAHKCVGLATPGLGQRSFFHLQLRGCGLDLQEGREMGLMREVRVLHVMTREFIRLAPTAGIG